MKAIIKKYYIFSLVLIFIFLSGCVNYAKFQMVSLNWQKAGDEKVTIEILFENWNDYDVYYNGVGSFRMRGVMFDPKDDDKKLAGDYWTKINSSEQLRSRLTQWNKNRYGTLYRILDAQGEFYGYMYLTSRSMNVVAKKINDNTFYVYDITPSHSRSNDEDEENQ